MRESHQLLNLLDNYKMLQAEDSENAPSGRSMVASSSEAAVKEGLPLLPTVQCVEMVLRELGAFRFSTP